MNAETEMRVAAATRQNPALRAVIEDLYARLEGNAAGDDKGEDRLEGLMRRTNDRFADVRGRLDALEAAGGAGDGA